MHASAYNVGPSNTKEYFRLVVLTQELNFYFESFY